jgi:hypothetical protein
MTIGVRLPAKDEEEEDYKAKAMNEVDAGRDRATPASLRHDDDEEDKLWELCFLPSKGHLLYLYCFFQYRGQHARAQHIPGGLFPRQI